MLIVNNLQSLHSVYIKKNTIFCFSWSHCVYPVQSYSVVLFHIAALSTVSDVCTLPKDDGPCVDYFQRWYYDKSDGYCKEFVYGGCEGNNNRFESEETCRSACNANLPIGEWNYTLVKTSRV